MNHHIFGIEPLHVQQWATTSPACNEPCSISAASSEPPPLQQWVTTSPAMSHHLSSNESPPLQQWVITSPAFTGTRVCYETFACFEQSLVQCTVFEVVEFHKHFPMDLWWAVLQGRQILKNIRKIKCPPWWTIPGPRGSKMRVQKGASK